MTEKLNTALKIRIPNFNLISLNRRGANWRAEFNVKEQQRLILGAYLKNLQNRTSLPITVVMRRVAPRKWDDDNLWGSMKGIRDILADYLIPGLAPGRADADPRIKWDYQQKRGKAHEIALEIEFIPAQSLDAETL